MAVVRFAWSLNLYSMCFFECVVAKLCWCMILEVVKVKVGDNLVEIGKFSLSDKKHGLLKHYYFCSFMKYLVTHE